MCIRVKTFLGICSVDDGSKCIAGILIIIGLLTIFGRIVGTFDPFGFLFGILILGSGLLLSWGLFRKSIFVLNSFLIKTSFNIACHIIDLIVRIILLINQSKDDSMDLDASQTLVDIVISVILIYFFVVVYSHKKFIESIEMPELEESSEEIDKKRNE